MMERHGEPLVLNGQRGVLAHNLVLPPLGVALGWLLLDYFHHDRIPLGTSIAAGLILGLAAIGGIVALLPVRLIVDDGGIHWSRWGKTQVFRWREIEDFGIARLRGMEGWDAPIVRFLTKNYARRHAPPPMIGLNVIRARSKYKDEATRSYRKGFTGYEVNLPNLFDQPVEWIVEEIRARRQLLSSAVLDE